VLAKRRRDPGALQIIGMPINFQMFGVDANEFASRNPMDQGVESMLNDTSVPIELRNGSLQLQSAPVVLRLFESSWRHLVYDSNMWLQWLARQILKMRNRKPIEAELLRVTIADNLEKQMIAAQMMMLNQLAGTMVSRSRRSRTTPAGATPPAARNWAKRSSVFIRGRPQPVVSAA
jgi:hypothetical protein